MPGSGYPGCATRPWALILNPFRVSGPIPVRADRFRLRADRFRLGQRIGHDVCVRYQRYRTLGAVDEGGFRIDAEQMVDRGEDILRGDRPIDDRPAVFVRLADDA